MLLQHLAEGSPRRSNRLNPEHSPKTTPPKHKGDKDPEDDGEKGEPGDEEVEIDEDNEEGAPPLEVSDPDGEQPPKGQKKKRKQVSFFFFTCLLTLTG
jgi:hypothetical protein